MRFRKRQHHAYRGHGLHPAPPAGQAAKPHHRRRLRRPFVWVALLMTAWATWGYFFPPAPRPGLLLRLEPRSGPVLVVVPHSDDETLATGGLLAQLEERGEKPRVVLVTGGDAFKVSAETYYRKVDVKPQEMLAFGRTRLAESRMALTRLGVPPDQLTFLGYPDQGLSRLWLECWRRTAPCASPTTGVTQVPYEEARSPGSPFAGEAAVGELEAIMREVRPAVVVYPHPNEAHVDHWGLSVLTTAALEDLRRTEPDWRPPEEWLYLVHRGDWPAPKGYRPFSPLLPPEKLAEGMTRWHTEPLTPEQVQEKARAVQAYQTQVVVLRRYMQSFVRTNELFGILDRVVLTDVPTHPISDPLTPPWQEQHWEEVITDPRADTVAREVERGGDVQAVWAARQGGMLFLAVRLASSPWAPVEFHLYARGYQSTRGWGDLTHVLARPNGSQQVLASPAPSHAWTVPTEVRGTWFRVAMPLDELGAKESVMVDVETRMGPALIDRTAWRALALDGR
jgi:LmbE family N-acetylglucosaminyl deacetylase